LSIKENKENIQNNKNETKKNKIINEVKVKDELSKMLSNKIINENEPIEFINMKE